MVAMKKADSACRSNFNRELLSRCRLNHDIQRRIKLKRQLQVGSIEERKIIDLDSSPYELDNDSFDEFPD